MIRVLFLFLLLQAGNAFGSYQRIVCLNPLVCEWVAEILGKDATLARVVGVSEYSNHPDVLRGVSLVGPYPKLHIEQIAALNPDLVLGSAEYNLQVQMEQLKRLKLNVVSLPKESFHAMEGWITTVGAALKEAPAASRARERWSKAWGELDKNRKPEKKIFIEVQHAPLISVGGGSFLSEALALVGYSNIFSSLSSGYPKVSTESVIRARPELILILDHAGESSGIAESKRDWARFSSLPAVRNGGIHALPGDEFARCSLRLLNALKGLRSRHEERNP
jgi:iron complex transport system substrate-binding protein